jgi:hypothetical protein
MAFSACLTSTPLVKKFVSKSPRFKCRQRPNLTLLTIYLVLLVLFSVKQYPQINFGYLLTQYTREFRTGYVEAAIDYFTLICLNADLPGALGKSQASVCHEALREFILETRDFAKLLGDIRADGTRMKGAIEERLDLIKLVDQEEFLKTITVQAAAVADDKGLIADAVLLYHLAENYDRVIDIINRALSDAVAVELGGALPKLQPLRPRDDLPDVADGSSLSLTSVDDPGVLAKNMISLYDSNEMYYGKVRTTNREACGLLLRMMEAKTQVEAGRWAPALDVSHPPGRSLHLDILIKTVGYSRVESPPIAGSGLRVPRSKHGSIILLPPRHYLPQHRTCHHVEYHLYWL